MSPGSVVVTGANRGIGIGLVQQLVKDKNISHIIATARDVEKANDLKAIQDPRLHILPLIVTCDESIDNFVSEVTEIVGCSGLNLLINNAIKYKTTSDPDRSTLAEQFDVNIISVVILTQKLLPLLRKAASKESGGELSVSRSAVINISSGQGSISNNMNGSGSFENLAYRMSKTAVNMFTKTISVDMRNENIPSVSLCPGSVKTDLGGKNGSFTIEQATSEMVASLYKLGAAHNGGYFQKNLDPVQY